jgi:virulence-associated protein VapD
MAEGRLKMTTGVVRERGAIIKQGLPADVRKEGRVYAIAFDMDIEQLRTNYGDPYNNAYLEIRRVLQRHGFTWQQGSVYFGGPDVTAVTCVLAALDLSRILPWFAASVRDIRMLRIEELNDLMPAVQQGVGGNGDT